jgi:hypothetical protein
MSEVYRKIGQQRYIGTVRIITARSGECGGIEGCKVLLRLVP